MPLAAKVLRWPAGPELLGLAGVVLAAGGMALVIWGARHDYTKTFEPTVRGTNTLRIARLSGTVGDTARGAAVVLVAAFLVDAAISGNPLQAKSVNAALQALAGDPGGPALLGMLGVGLPAYAAYSVTEARYRRL